MLPRCVAAGLLALGCAAASAAQVRVAVAANFGAPMQQIAAAFERDTGHQALLALGSTGKFYAQIRHGAPFAVLLAADAETPARLLREGRAVAGSGFTYAVGRLVLWSRQPGLAETGPEVLAAGRFKRIALADPQRAPYGAAAVEALSALGHWPALEPKAVRGESIAQAYQFVASGNAELGLVALSQVFSQGRLLRGSAWVVPAQLHRPIRQDAVLLAAGKDDAAAAALLAYLRGATARAIIRSFGYEI